jgi:mannose-6-phosphate isomerase-like protein (cupin superfamily)
MTFGPINLAAKLDSISTHWSPHVVARDDVMVVKVKGEFNWHSPPDTDDLFVALKGQIAIEMRDQTATLNTGDLFVVPCGVKHRPVARDEAHLLLIEPRAMPNTGDPDTAAPKPRI